MTKKLEASWNYSGYSIIEDGQYTEKIVEIR